MKLLTFAIPCYNSQDYMEKCVESILPGGEDVEIIIVDDGSTDRTREIADTLAAQYPSIIRAIHQENGGHGEAVNTGVRNATGKYFKVVDSDDWVDADAYQKILKRLKKLDRDGEEVDMFLANYVYEKEGAKHKKVMRQAGFPKDQIFSWADVKHFYKGHYILMHSVIYRTALLRECGMRLPAHTFYVDNIYVYHPLPSVHRMYYMDVDFYRYYIGREDQSVNENVMISRIDQQIKVNKIMVDAYDLEKVENEHCRQYMFNYLEIITTISSILCLRSGTDENILKKCALWKYIRRANPRLYAQLRKGLLGHLLHIPGRGGRMVAVKGYQLAQKVVGFN